jgi:hypothetical protein
VQGGELVAVLAGRERERAAAQTIRGGAGLAGIGRGAV